MIRKTATLRQRRIKRMNAIAWTIIIGLGAPMAFMIIMFAAMMAAGCGRPDIVCTLPF